MTHASEVVGLMICSTAAPDSPAKQAFRTLAGDGFVDLAAAQLPFADRVALERLLSPFEFRLHGPCGHQDEVN
jgi:hypothetical protein